jgi:surfeit locus 1 family protein
MKRVSLLPSIFILALLALLLSLGNWQLNRAEEKRDIESKIIAAQTDKPIHISSLEQSVDREFYKITLEGYFDDKKNIIYDNQTENGVAGYYVLTPFMISKTDAFLVNRGFVRWGADRNVLSVNPVASNYRVINGTLKRPKERMTLKDSSSEVKFPYLIQSLNMEKLASSTDLNIGQLMVELDKDQPDGFIRNWQPFYGTVDKHIGYAIQWFSMAAVLILISFFIYIRKY